MKEIKGMTMGEFTTFVGSPDKPRGNLGSLIIQGKLDKGEKIVIIDLDYNNQTEEFKLKK